jgi:catalase
LNEKVAKKRKKRETLGFLAAKISSAFSVHQRVTYEKESVPGDRPSPRADFNRYLFALFMKNISHTSLVFVIAVLTPVIRVLAQDTEAKATPQDMIDAFHTAFGEHHARAVHAKGVVLEGHFSPDPGASALTKAFHLQKTSSRVVIRFSNFTGIPDIPDNSLSANPRGMAVKFIMPDGADTDIVSHSFNGFPTQTADQFRAFLLAVGASGPGAPKPNAVDHFLETHPVTKTFLTSQHTPASYATITYFGVNSFQCTNAKGETHFIRYQLIPTEGEHFLTEAELAEKDAFYLANEIKERVSRGTFGFRLYAQVAESGDAIEDPSVAWPEQRKRIFLGTITIEKVAENTPQADKAVAFNPGNIPDGIATADPMLNIRAAAYPISLQHRQ